MKMLYKLLIVLGALLTALLPVTSQASQCLLAGSEVDARNGFCFTFKIDSDGTNRVRLESSRIFYPLWTDDFRFNRYNPAIYERNYINERKERTFRVKFERFNNSASKIKGRLTYYVDGVQVWRDNSFDLTKATGITPRYPNLKLNLVGDQFDDPDEYCITSGSCADIDDVPEIDLPLLCRYFPEPIQGWNATIGDTTSTLTVTNNTARAIGWSESYKLQYSITNEKGRPQGPSKLLRTGFNNVDSIYTEENIYNYDVCGDDLGCEVGDDDGGLLNRKIIQPELISTSFGTQSLTITNTNVASICRNSALCEISASGKNAEIEITSDLSELNININGGPYNRVTVEFDDQIAIGSMNVTGGTSTQIATLFEDDSTVTFGNVRYIRGDITLQFEHNARINVVSSWMMENAFTFEQIEGALNTIFYGPEADFVFKAKTGRVDASILGKSVSFENPMTINGSVTSQNLTMKSGVVISKPNYSCSIPPTNELTLIVEPQYQFALTCERVPVLFKTVDENGVITQPSDSSFSATANPANSSQWCESNSGGTCSATGQDYSSTLTNGQKTLYLSARTLQQYAVEGTWDNKTESGTTSIQFVPFKFSADNINVIAGRPYDQNVRVLACDDGSTETVSYLGTPTINWDVELPSGGSIGSTPTFAPSFTNTGSITTPVQVNESGQFKVTLRDTSFECSEIAGCPESGIGNLAGSFIVKSRPWTFAVCPSSNAGGDSTSGSGFVPAGETFALSAKPVVWSSSLAGNASDGTALRLRQKEASSNAFCSLPTTSNFYINDSATNVAASLSHSLATPTAGIAGTMLYDGPVDNHSNSSEIPFTGISVTEVGSFHFAVDASNSFYNAIEGGIDTGARELGRFYPRYFRAVGEDWDYFGSQGFNYMNQNFDQVSFDVEALSGGTTPQAVENYQHFASAMQARFNLYDDDQPERLIFPDFGAATWQGTNQSIGRFSALPSGHCSDSNLTSLCWVKADTAIGYEDGPFNLNGTTTNPTDIRLTLESGPDPVEYWDSGELLTTQPDLRFGRVALDSLGSTVNTTLNIPLRVEFWNGERFVVNSDDDAVSTILGESTSTNNNNIWVEEGQTAETLSFANGGLVNDGESNSITVTHASQVRQQTQIWLELDNTRNDMPWLRYNWDDDLASDDANGEQDPSSVVTFGIYRGNDRVIFRGEPGLTGQ